MPVWIETSAWNIAFWVAALTAAIMGGIDAVRRGRRHRLRRIGGIDAIERAIERAAELGQPVLYVAGVRDLDDTQTVASLSILRAVAEQAARYRCSLIMPTDRSLVMAAARETCRAAYAAAGRAEDYRDDMVTYVSDEQFAFAARVDGIIARQRPATCLLLGSFFAESLLMAEASRQAGALTIAGTAGWHQLPFLVAACDHVLIGEELFVAGAYLADDPALTGSVRGQDLAKYLAMSILVAGALLGIGAAAGWLPAIAVREALLRLLQES